MCVHRSIISHAADMSILRPVAASADDVVRMEAMTGTALANPPAFEDLERHRRELTAHCYRMLGSPFEAEDAVQDTLLRAWRALDSFERRASLRSWLYRIATNVCLDMLDSKQRRARPMDLGEARSPDGPIGEILPETL